MVIEPPPALAGISSMAMRDVLAELGDAYSRKTGQRVLFESVGGVDAARRVRGGEAFDVVVLAAGAIDELEAAGRTVAGSRVDVARSTIAVAVAAGARRPDIGSEAALRAAVVAAASIGISTGPSGAHLARLLDRWRIASEVSARIVKAPPGVAVATLVARGDAEIGFQQLSELINARDVDVVGELPPEIQETTIFAGALCAASAWRDAAGALLRFLASADAATAKRRHGMAPA